MRKLVVLAVNNSDFALDLEDYLVGMCLKLLLLIELFVPYYFFL